MWTHVSAPHRPDSLDSRRRWWKYSGATPSQLLTTCRKMASGLQARPAGKATKKGEHSVWKGKSCLQFCCLKVCSALLKGNVMFIQLLDRRGWANTPYVFLKTWCNLLNLPGGRGVLSSTFPTCKLWHSYQCFGLNVSTSSPKRS